MGLIIRVSPTVRRWLGKGTVTERNPSSRADITLIAYEDDGPWVRNAHMRLRPHFVSNAEEAQRVWTLYEQFVDSE